MASGRSRWFLVATVCLLASGATFVVRRRADREGSGSGQSSLPGTDASPEVVLVVPHVELGHRDVGGERSGACSR
jgi:hypothetical protein